jgi:molybdenum cofactor biosynthesis enzyme MoaA
MVTADDIQSELEREFDLTPVPSRGSAPAEEFYVNGGPATVGIIASVTRPFCAACDRLRLTADGQFRNCLLPVMKPMCVQCCAQMCRSPKKMLVFAPSLNQ